MAQFTPGPWAVNPAVAQVDAFDSGKPVPVCQLLWPTEERTEAETEANAKLIAAAPELLAALQEVREWISNWSPNFEQDDEWPATAARMDAALAKATA